jgi:alpha-glucosidase
LQLYRRLIELRRTRPALLFGAYRPIAASGDLLMFVREFAGERLLIALNLGGEATTATFPSGQIVGRWALSSHLDRGGEAVRGSIDLRPHEGAVIEVFPR